MMRDSMGVEKIGGPYDRSWAVMGTTSLGAVATINLGTRHENGGTEVLSSRIYGFTNAPTTFAGFGAVGALQATIMADLYAYTTNPSYPDFAYPGKFPNAQLTALAGTAGSAWGAGGIHCDQATRSPFECPLDLYWAYPSGTAPAMGVSSNDFCVDGGNNIGTPTPTLADVNIALAALSPPGTPLRGKDYTSSGKKYWVAANGPTSARLPGLDAAVPFGNTIYFIGGIGVDYDTDAGYTALLARIAALEAYVAAHP